MIDKVFVFGDKDVADVMVAKPDVVGGLDRPAARGGARRRPRLAVHALSGLPRVARRHRRRPPRARPLQRDPRPWARRGPARGAAAAGVRRPRDEGPRLAPAGVPEARTTTSPSWSTSTAGWSGSRRSRICSRRSSARSRTSSTSPRSRSSRSARTRTASTGCSRSTSSTSASAPSCRTRTSNTVAGFVFGQLGRVAGAGRRRLLRRDALRRARGGRQPNRADRSDVRAAARASPRRVRGLHRRGRRRVAESSLRREGAGPAESPQGFGVRLSR